MENPQSSSVTPRAGYHIWTMSTTWYPGLALKKFEHHRVGGKGEGKVFVMRGWKGIEFLGCRSLVRRLRIDEGVFGAKPQSKPHRVTHQPALSHQPSRQSHTCNHERACPTTMFLGFHLPHRRSTARQTRLTTYPRDGAAGSYLRRCRRPGIRVWPSRHGARRHMTMLSKRAVKTRAQRPGRKGLPDGPRQPHNNRLP